MSEKLLKFKWTVSRGRDTYGYNICSLFVDGVKVAACNGGGYDMQGTSLGTWLAGAYKDRLLKLKTEFYGLTFHNPTFDAGKAIIGKDCQDRTLGGADKDMTVEEAEAKGITAGLERYQAFYSASSKLPTEKHVEPLLDGACGFSCMEAVAKEIGLKIQWNSESKNATNYILTDEQANK